MTGAALRGKLPTWPRRETGAGGDSGVKSVENEEIEYEDPKETTEPLRDDRLDVDADSSGVIMKQVDKE